MQSFLRSEKNECSILFVAFIINSPSNRPETLLLHNQWSIKLILSLYIYGLYWNNPHKYIQCLNWKVEPHPQIKRLNFRTLIFFFFFFTSLRPFSNFFSIHLHSLNFTNFKNWNLLHKVFKQRKKYFNLFNIKKKI